MASPGRCAWTGSASPELWRRSVTPWTSSARATSPPSSHSTARSTYSPSWTSMTCGESLRPMLYGNILINFLSKNRDHFYLCQKTVLGLSAKTKARNNFYRSAEIRGGGWSPVWFPMSVGDTPNMGGGSGFWRFGTTPFRCLRSGARTETPKNTVTIWFTLTSNDNIAGNCSFLWFTVGIRFTALRLSETSG